MKLIYISNNRMPTELAHGLQVMQMCEAFSENNFDVDLIVPKRINPIKKDPFSYYGVERRFDIKKIPCLDLIFLSGKNIFFWIQTFSFLLFCKIYLIFKKYEILYTREQAVGIFFKNYVLELHSLPHKIKPFHKKIWLKSKYLVVLTSFIKQKLIEVGIPSEKIFVSPDGVKLNKFNLSITKEEARERIKLPKDKRMIGYVGMLRTLGMEKGIDDAIKALQFLGDKNTVLVLVGGYPHDIEFYKQLALKIGVLDKILFVGKVNHELVPYYLKAFDVLIAPFPENEHYSYFMSPMKIFEYMASGRPIITTNLPSLKEVVGNGEAILIPPGNSRELSKAIEKILKDEKLAGEISKKALDSVNDFSWKIRAERILNFIR